MTIHDRVRFPSKDYFEIYSKQILISKPLRIDRLFTEMLGQHVINNGAIFVPFGTAICFDHAIDFIHQFRPIRLAKFLDKKIVFDCFQLALLAPSNCGRIRILD